mgnify:CR=1 FL=1
MEKNDFLKSIILKDALLRCLNLENADEIHSVIKKVLLETSDHWQERMVAEGAATEDDFFYDTYLGPPEVAEKFIKKM